MGAFTDGTGAVIEPVAIGAAARSFIVPAGAVQLQLGVDDAFYADNTGTGFVVSVNGEQVTVPATAMPWKWAIGGLNGAFQYGVNDGTSPILAATGLSAGQVLQVAYQSGTVLTGYPLHTATNADGDQTFITGTTLSYGTYYPTLFTTPSAYPLNLPLPVSALVTSSSGAPVPSVPVTLNVAGANPGVAVLDSSSAKEPHEKVPWDHTARPANRSLRSPAGFRACALCGCQRHLFFAHADPADGYRAESEYRDG